jgi:hypothetical protein
MSSSGTVGQTTIEVSDLLDHIIRRCGKMPSDLTPENVASIKNSLFFFLSGLSNRGINLWRVTRSLMAIYPNQAEYTLAAGTLDLLNVLYRTPERLSGTITTSDGGTTSYLDDSDTDTVFTQSGPTGNVYWDFSSDTTVGLVGVLPGASTTWALVFETSEDASTWTAIKTVGSTAYTDGTWVWYELEPSRSARYFRVRTTAGTLSFRELFLSASWTEVQMYRMNRDDYSNLPNKRTASDQPLQFWLDRQLTPKMVVWPVPSNTFRLMNVFAHMHIEDVGAISNTLNIPQHWYKAVVTNVAYDCLLDLPGTDVKRFEMLGKQAQDSMIEAEAEERDASPTKWSPNISAYTA